MSGSLSGSLCRQPAVLLAGAIALAVLACSACSTTSPATESKKAIQRGEYVRAVMAYRKAVDAAPDNIEYRLRLRDIELQAADYYYDNGSELLAGNNIDGAIGQFQQGLISMPHNTKLEQAINSALRRKEADALVQEAERLYQAGRTEEAREGFSKALDANPEDKRASQDLAAIDRRAEQENASRLILSSREPITLQFRQTPLKAAFEFVAKAFGVNLIFDDQVESPPVTLYAKNVSFEQAINLMLTTTKTFYKKVGPNTILVAPDTADKRAQFEDQLMRTYQLNNVRAKDMLAILKGVITPKKTIVNEELNTLIVRDSEPILKLTDRLIQNNDRKPAETIIAVEILEVNRTKAEQLGLDFGQQMTTQFPTVNAGRFMAAIQSSTTTLPAITFSFFKHDVDAKTLANPRIRVISAKTAKIHIGDRVPLVSAVIQDATGQTRTTYNYTDIGVVLTVEPVIHLDNTVTIKLGLEVSTLGQNLGTTTQPAYSIGTRTAETYMELRDGETAILGGLIQDSDQRTITGVPGLGDIPAVGALFRSRSTSTSRTDVLLTITPRVLRPWDLANRSDLEFYSGTVNEYKNGPLFADLEPRGAGAAPVSVIKMGEGGAAPEIGANAPVSPVAPGSAAPAGPGGAAPGVQAVEAITFSEPVYTGQVDQELAIDVVGEGLGATGKAAVDMLFNPELLEFVRAEPGAAGAGSFDAKAENGALHLTMSFAGTKGAAGKAALARIVLRGKKKGVSYLVYRAPQFTTDQGVPINAQTRASRVVIQ